MAARVQAYPGAQAVSRAIAVLKVFSDERPEWTLAEIGRALKLNKATAHRLLAALESEGLVARDPRGEAYRLGPEAIVLGGRALRANTLRVAARPELEALARKTSETATLETLVGHDILILDEALSQRLVGGAPSIGTRWPAHATSTGKVLLAFGPKAAQASAARRTLPRFTANTITSAARLRRELARARQAGCAIVREELEIGYVAVAAPAFDHDGRPVAAVCVGGPAARLTARRLDEIAPLVKQAAASVSRRLGFRPSRPGRS